MKIQFADPKINPFGGNVMINQLIEQNHITLLIDSYLGERPPQATYNHSDFLKAIWSIFYAGGGRLEDIHSKLKSYAHDWFDGKAPSSDSILNFMKEQACENTVRESQQNIPYCFNANESLNRLNMRLVKHLDLVGEDGSLDYDNLPLEHDKNPPLTKPSLIR